MITSVQWLPESSQWPRLAACVPRWLKEVPLYQRRPLTARCSGLLPEFLRCFHSLPIITKQEIQSGFPRNFLPTGVELEKLIVRI